MLKRSLAAAFVFALVAGSAQAMVFTNGSFETGDYTGWTLHESSEGGCAHCGTWGIAFDGETINPGDSTFDHFDGVLVTQGSPGLPRTYTPSHGNYMAYQLQTSGEFHAMGQELDLTGVDTIYWDMFYENFAGEGEGPDEFDPDEQAIAVTLRDGPGGAVLDTVFLTEPGDPASVAMQTFSADVSAFTGETIFFEVDMPVFFFFFDAGFDNFRTNLEMVGIPEPTTLSLMGIGLLGAGLARRRRKAA